MSTCLGGLSRCNESANVVIEVAEFSVAGQRDDFSFGSAPTPSWICVEVFHCY